LSDLYPSTCPTWVTLSGVLTPASTAIRVFEVRNPPVISPRVLSPFHGGGIAYLNDPDSYAGWSFYTPVVEG